MSTGCLNAKRNETKHRHAWLRIAMAALAFLLTVQWAYGQACTVSITTNPPSPVLVGQSIALNATVNPSSSFGTVNLDGQLICSSFPCGTTLDNVSEGVHTLGWSCTNTQGGGTNSGSQQLAVGQGSQDFLPAYYILSLLYAPPGNGSSNGFTNSKDTGTSTQITQSFNHNVTTQFSFTFKDLLGLQLGGQAGFEQDAATITAFTETFTNAAGVTVQSAVDPLSHYQDRFFIWLNPEVTVTQTGSSAGVFVVKLPPDANGNFVPPSVVDVTVAELVNPAQIPLEKLESRVVNGVTIPGLSSICAQPVACTTTNACGCVPSDFANIVKQDPLVFDPNNPTATDPNAQPTAVDPVRYVLKQTELLTGPDCPPPTCGPVQRTFTVTDATENGNGTQNTNQYSVQFSVGFTLGIFNLQTMNTWTWSDQLQIQNNHGNSTSASVTFGSSTPQCQEDYNIYEDIRFHTFTFAPASTPPTCLQPVQDFNVVAFPPSDLPLTVINGGSATYLVSSVGMLGFNATENLSVSGMPAGMTATFSPANFNLSPTNSIGTSILTITAGNNVTPAGNYPLNVIGTGGGQSHSAPIQINVQDFQLTVTPNSPNTTTTGTTTYTVTVTPQNGFNSTVLLGIGPLPVGVSGSFAQNFISGSGSTTLTITTNGASPGNFTFTVTGTAGTDSQTVTANLSIVDFTISASPSSQTLAQGGSITYTVSTGALNGFSDPINLSVSGLPTGVTGAFNPASINGAGSSTLTLTALSTAQLGSKAFSINASSRGVTHSAGATVVVNPPPSITSLSPSQAPVGAFVTISGSNFNSAQGTSTLSVGGVLTTPTSWSDTTVVFAVPSSLGFGNAAVVITVNGSVSNSVNLSVTAGITSISPASGPIGTSLTITGTNFGTTQGPSSVTIGGLSAPVATWSNTSLTVTVPSGLPLGNAPVVVIEGGLASNSVNFTVTPGITSLSPPSGPVGTAVTITGTNFGATQGGSTVTFAGTSAAVTSWSDTSIVAIAPGLGVGSASVVVTVNGAASNSATYTFTPGITSLSPISGPIGTVVTINGSDFGTTQGSSTVTIGGVSITPTSWSNTSIVFTVPSLGLGAAPVTVTVGGVPGPVVNFTVTPGITSLSPATAAIGSAVTISGTNFGATQGSSTVTFGGIATTPTSWSANSIVAPVPAGLAAGNTTVVVTVSGLSSPGASFKVSPGITSLSPTSGPVSSTITITGTSFGATQSTSTVTVGGVTVTPTSWSNISVKVPVPASLGLGSAPVVVTVAGLPSNSVNFNVTPGTSSLSPASGPTGTTVTITGTNFGATQGSSTVTISGLTVTPASWSNTAVTFVVPSSLGLGAAPVIVTVGGTASNTLNFTVTPGITSLSPASGPVGTSVTVNGTNFGSSQGASTLTFGGSAITPSSWSNGSIGFTVPGVPAGTVNVVVNVNGLSSNLATFTVTPVVSNLSLISGPAGTAITITGSNFGANQNSSSVTFAGIASSPSSWSDTGIAVTVPAGIGPGSSPVIVTVNGAPSNTSFFTATPSIASLSPNSGVTGATVTIGGSAFGASQGASTITFNGVAATVTSWSNTNVAVKVPASATSGNVVVTVNNIPSNGAPFTVYSPTVYFQTPAASSTSGLLQLQTTTPTSPTNLLSADLVNQPAGEYLIQAFDTQAGVPNSTASWQASLSATITVYMNQASGTTGTLFPDVKLFLNSPAGTPICSAVSSSALTTTQTLYTLTCTPAANITLSPSDRFYLWVGVSSTGTSSVSEKAQLTVGPPSRGRQGGNVSVPVR